MKRLMLVAIVALPVFAQAGAYSWRCAKGPLVLTEYDDTALSGFDFAGSVIRKEDVGTTRPGVAYVGVELYGYQEDGGLYLKQYDRTATPMPVDNDYVVAAFYGEVLGEDTIMSSARLALSMYDTESAEGGTYVGPATDFYLGFIVTEKEDFNIIENSRKWYGWARFTFDGRYSLVDSDVNLDGGPIVVGEHWLAEPEPASGLLAAFGLVAVLLRRRRG